MADIVVRSTPTITSLGLIITKAKMGGTPQQVEQAIVDIVGAWRHLVFGTLEEALKDFGAATRASANLAVSWVGDFTVIHDIFDIINDLIPDKDRERKRNWWRQWKKKFGLAKG